ncbi:GDSL-type esterase/lipase family protein [Alteromonas facilis]|uniref:GDSL-type esterase/lipase family protein n=1 Tax=Alteromonas facilis TaxID=2048004 RepID=UPI0013DCAB5B|nr:GDSL-type esterase/lipase family protein [Alteromonas facilis]
MSNLPAIASCPLPNSEKPGWMSRHQQKLQDIKRIGDKIRLVFIGDSIIEGWETKALSNWQKAFSHYGPLNLGFGGDRTEHVLWRLNNGELSGYTAHAIVLLIGTNNTGHRQDPADQTAAAISDIINTIQNQQPHAHIILHSLLPRAKRPTHRLRQLNESINALIAPLADNPCISWKNINHLFLDDTGLMLDGVMDDYLHPNAEQYPRWANELLPDIDELIETQ